MATPNSSDGIAAAKLKPALPVSLRSPSARICALNARSSAGVGVRFCRSSRLFWKASMALASSSSSASTPAKAGTRMPKSSVESYRVNSAGLVSPAER